MSEVKRTVFPPHALCIPAQAECVFNGVIYDVYHWQQTMFDGSTATFEMLKRPDTIKVIAIRDGKIVILEQQQPDTKLFYDVPGGRHDHPGETEVQAAQRELKEETGLEFAEWRLLSVTQPHGKVEQFIYIYLASEFVSETEQQLDAGEKISVHYLTLAEVKQLFDAPNARYLPKEILSKVDSVEELRALPEADVVTITD